MPNFIDEYLIKLGASVDSAGLSRFQSALTEAASLVDHKSVAMAGSFLRAQVEIVGGFAAIGTAALGLVDSVANADQEFRLFALHMYMSKDAARSLKITMDALGQPLENLAWDTELRERAKRLIELQANMAPGGDFEEQMYKVRSIRAEFSAMEVELKYLGMHVVQDFLNALGVGPDELLIRLRGFNNWVSTHLPELSRRIVEDFLPIWRDILAVLKATGDAMREGAVLFTNLVGMFSGDRSIEGTTLSLENLATALTHVGSGFADFGVLFAHIEELLSHFAIGTSLLSSGKLGEAGAEFKAGFNSLTAKELLTISGGVAGTLLGGPLGGIAGAGLAYGLTTAADKSGAHGLVEAAAAKYGIDPAVLHALAMAESGESQFGPGGGVLSSSSGALGIMQLLPSTAKALGVDPTQAGSNVTGGAWYFKTLMDRYKDIPTAIAAYHEGEPKMQRILAGKDTLSDEAYREVAKVMAATGAHGDVHIGSIVVHVDKSNATGKEIAAAIQAEQEKAAKSSQRNQLQFQSVGTAW